MNLPSNQRGAVHPFPLILCVLVTDPKPVGVPVTSGKKIPQKRLREDTERMLSLINIPPLDRMMIFDDSAKAQIMFNNCVFVKNSDILLCFYLLLTNKRG